MQETDVDACVGVIEAMPAIARRYGPAIAALRLAWRHLIRREAMRTAVFEEVEGGRTRVWGVGVGVFVHDAFVHALKRPPMFWFGPELARRATRSDSPILSDGEVREANSTNGLNLLVWEGWSLPEFSTRPDANRLRVSAFLDGYRGFRIKEAITSQVESAERLQWNIDAGGLLWDPADARYVHTAGRDLAVLCSEPHLVGTTPEVEASRLGSWIGPLFDYHPPRVGFSKCEQRLLTAALPGRRTDEELCRDLDTTVPAVKSTWRTIFTRAASRLPDLFEVTTQMDAGSGKRGKERRRLLLAYLRDHPEELRPLSQRIIDEGPRIAGSR
jgi:hypothetical protein